MKIKATIALIFSVLVVGSSSGQDEQASETKWQRLFNGKDLEGWEGAFSSIENDWKVVDGVLQADGGGGGWIMAPGEHENFRLLLEFRVSKGANSGVFLRAPAKSSTPHVEGLEVQLIDDMAGQDDQIDRKSRCGALLLETGPSKDASKAANEWQKLAIQCKGAHIRVFLNGQEVINHELDKTEPLGRHPGRERTKGRIGFQDRGERVDFRNVWILKLP